MRFALALSFIVFFSCKSSTTKNSPDALSTTDTFAENLLKPNSVKELVSLNHRKLAEIKGDLGSSDYTSKNYLKSNWFQFPVYSIISKHASRPAILDKILFSSYLMPGLMQLTAN